MRKPWKCGLIRGLKFGPRQSNLKAIQKWWKDEHILNALPSQERDFVRSTQENPSATFKPLAIFCLKASLRKWVVGPDRYARAVWNYQRFLEDREVDLATTSLNPTAGEIVKMSSLVDAEKNAVWYHSWQNFWPSSITTKRPSSI